MKLHTHALTAIMLLPVAGVGVWFVTPVDARLDAHLTRVAARADVLTAKDALGREILVGSDRVDAARRLYEARNEAWGAVMQAPDTVPAYPGATGGGATALIECRSLPLKVWKVQSLDAVGDGTLKAILADSVSSANFDIIIFDTAGTIPPTGNARFRDIDDKDCAYIAAQTAKGGLQLIGGTGLGGAMLGSSHPTGGSSNSIWRYIHIRCVIAVGQTNDCMSIDHRNSPTTDGENIWDHVSASGGNDELYDGSDGKLSSGQPGVSHLTLSYNLFYGVPDHHPGGAGVGAGLYPTCDGSGSSVFLNLFSSTHHRQPANVGSAPACAEILNNLVYNQAPRNTVVSDSTLTDWAGNYIEQVATPSGDKNQSVMSRVTIRPPDGPQDCVPAAADTLGGGSPADECIKFFVEKNLWVTSGVADIDTTVDQWSTVCDGGKFAPEKCGQTGSYPGIGVDSTYYRSYVSLFGVPKFPYTRVQAASVPSLLIGSQAGYDADSVNVGANGWIGCSGASLEVGTGALTGVGFTRQIDGMDSLAVNDIKTSFNRGYSNVLEDYAPGGQLPVFTAAGPRCADTDGDGMPDQWEVAHTNVNFAVADANSDVDADGWLAMEEYVNGSDPDVFTNTSGSITGGTGPAATFGNGRWVYQDTLVRYLQITAGGADTDSVFMPDTSEYSPTDLSPFTYILKDIPAFTTGDVVLILVNDSIVGRVAKQLDSAQVDSLAGVVGSEGEWARCGSRGICTDSLRNRDIP